MLSLLLAATLNTPTASAQQAPVVRTLPAAMPSVSVHNPNGAVTVRYQQGLAESSVTLTPVRWAEGCAADFSGSKEIAQVTVAREQGWHSRCRTDIDVVLAGPSDLTVTGRGKVAIDGVPGDVNVRLARGRLELNEVAGQSTVFIGTGRVEGSLAGAGGDVEVRRGRIRLEGLEAPVQATVGIGGVRLAYDVALDGEVMAKAGLGQVRVAFPYGTWLDNRSDAKLGRVKTAIPSHWESATQLSATTGVGGVRIDTILEDVAAPAGEAVASAEVPAP